MEPSFLRTRSFDPAHGELMDNPSSDPGDLAVDLKNLTRINRHFGGRSACRFILSQIEKLNSAATDREFSWLDCATGAGDLPQYMARKMKFSARFVLLDLNPATLEFARSSNAAAGLSCPLVRGDMLHLPFADHSFDIVTCQLALHHFCNEDAVHILRELQRVSRRFVFVTDLVRSPLAYFGIWCLVKLWLRHPMTQHDALLSIRRAFTPQELRDLARDAGWNKPSDKTLPWFRHAVWLVNTAST